MSQYLKNKTKVAVLGEGVTGRAVKNALNRLGLKEVSVSEAELIVTSPGIPPREWPKTDTKILSEVEFAYELFEELNERPFIIAITGTNGKTTVTEMTSLLCDAPACGNIGKPLIEYVGVDKKEPCLVVELSSYQVEFCKKFKPDVAILINLSPDHFERHVDMTGYYNAKAGMIRQMGESETIIVNAEDEWMYKMAKESKASLIEIRSSQLKEGEYPNPPVSHRFMRLNAELSIQAAMQYKKTRKESLEKLKKFELAPHRIEYVRTINEVTYYNDSKATNPHATLSALESLDGKIHLMLCGEDKKLDLKEFIESVNKRVESVVVFGDLKTVIEQNYKKYIDSKKWKKVDTLEEALGVMKENAKPGEKVLFSPSSSSYDQFKGYENRGNKFKESVCKR